MKKVKIKIDLDKITKKVIKEHQMLKGELKRIEKLINQKRIAEGKKVVQLELSRRADRARRS